MEDQSPNFSEFPVSSYEEWHETTVRSLKSTPFEKLITHSYEGIDLIPMYRAEDTRDIAHQHTLPGQFPYVRGTDALGYVRDAWHIAQALPYGTPEDFNTALRHDLERGQTAINLMLDAPTRSGLDPDQAQAGEVGVGGVSIAGMDDLAAALAGVDLSTVPVIVHAGTAALPLTALLLAHLRKLGLDTHTLTGGIQNDPLGELALTGMLPMSLEKAYDEIAQLTRWAAENAPNLHTIGVNGMVYHNAGSSAVQELALVMATGTAYLRAQLARGLDIDTAAAHISFGMGLGANFFMEIAKLRAARILWAQIVKAFGGSDDAQKMSVHAQTGLYNKTQYDPYVNMLRVTTEALSGAIGGVSSMNVLPFDAPLRTPDEFSRRIARNVQLMLQKEANITRLIDPAGGSWYIEYLTDQVAQKAWVLFQDIEGQGGMFSALESGSVQTQIDSTAAERSQNIARRKDRIVGTNMYPNLDEKPIPTDTVDYDALYQRRAETLRAHRTSEDTASHTQTLHQLAEMLSAPLERMIDAAVEAARAGATLNELTRTLRANFGDGPSVTPVTQRRAAEAYENLRRATEAYAAQHGSAPQVFLANMGPLAQHKARKDFTRGFLEVSGFAMIDPAGFDSADAAGQAALDSGASIVVICSTDDTYPEIVPPLTQAIKAAKAETVVLVAGYPKEHIESFQAAGVDDFIHLRANCYEMNRQLQEKIGVRNNA